MSRFSRLLTVGLSVLAAVSHASTIPSQDAVFSRGIELLPADTDLSVRNWTTFKYPTALSTIGAHELASIPQTAVVVAVLYTNAQIVSSVCAATAATGPAGVAVCGVTAVTAVIVSFFTLWRASSGPAGTPNPVRSIEAAPGMLLHSAFLPKDACGTVCQLKANTPHATWTAIGNVTIDGVHHDVHFSQKGQVLGIRAVTGAAGGIAKRDDYDDDNGIVATYFWEDDSETAWNDFDRSAITGIANDIGAYFVESNAPIICADLLDQDGAVDAGIMTIDNNNDELALAGDSYDEALAYCLAGDPNVP